MRRREFCLGMIAATASGAYAAAAAPLGGLFARGVECVGIGAFAEFGDGRFLFDYPRNRAGALVAEATGFDVLSSFDKSGKPVAQLTPAAGGIRYLDGDWRAEPLARSPFRLQNGDVQIAGELVRRVNASPRGAVVLVHGSGPAPRDTLDFWALEFLSQGLAVAAYDKRGCGLSTGDWRSSGFEALAADGRAVVRHVRRQLPGTATGLWGVSQAGWIMPQIADAADFVVMHMGGVTSPAQQSVDEIEAELRAYEFPPDEIARALAYYRLDRDVSLGRAPWSAIDRAYQEASAAKAEWLLAPPLPEASPDRRYLRLIGDFDSAPYWRACRTPLLAIFGGKDIVVPADRNAALLKSLLPPAAPATIRVLPSANHLGMVGKTGVRAEYAACSDIDPEYFPLVNGWIGRHLHT